MYDIPRRTIIYAIINHHPIYFKLRKQLISYITQHRAYNSEYIAEIKAKVSILQIVNFIYKTKTSAEILTLFNVKPEFYMQYSPTKLIQTAIQLKFFIKSKFDKTKYVCDYINVQYLDEMLFIDDYRLKFIQQIVSNANVKAIVLKSLNDMKPSDIIAIAARLNANTDSNTIKSIISNIVLNDSTLAMYLASYTHISLLNLAVDAQLITYNSITRNYDSSVLELNTTDSKLKNLKFKKQFIVTMINDTRYYKNIESFMKINKILNLEMFELFKNDVKSHKIKYDAKELKILLKI